MPQLFDSLYKFSNNETLTAAKLNTRFQNLDSRIAPLEVLKLTFDGAQSSALAELQLQAASVVQNLKDQLASLTSLNWLVSTSTTPLNLTVGAQLQLLVDPAAAQLFAPGPFTILSRAGDVNTYAVVRSVGYIRSSGTYAFQVMSVAGTPGTYGDWEIAAVAGCTLAQMSLLIQVQQVLASASGIQGAAAASALQASNAANIALGSQGAAAASATAAASQATAASQSAASAAASATLASRIAGNGTLNASSSSTLTVGLGLYTLIIPAAAASTFFYSQYMAIVAQGDARNAMAGFVQSYTPSTGVLVIRVIQSVGSGTYSSWLLAPANPPAVPTAIDGGVYDAPSGGNNYAAVTFTTATSATSQDGGTY